MRTQRISNYKYPPRKVSLVTWLCLSFVVFAFLERLFVDLAQAIVITCILISICAFIYQIYQKSYIEHIFTAAHLQQNLRHGGWVIQWQNIAEVNVVTIEQEGWHQELPWVGIRLKEYSPILKGICPRIISDILLQQRPLLILGCRHHKKPFEDIVLDEKEYISPSGQVYTGLNAMLVNRMRHQRRFFGFDLYISESDIRMDKNEFIGIARRYLAAKKENVECPKKD
ncbi:DUF2982 domain-containing protein [Vibrio sp.]|nr:DUF2982 domain-containing protein [Vibrio sp.]